MDKQDYSSPEIIELGKAKDVIKDAMIEGTGDAFPGAINILASV